MRNLYEVIDKMLEVIPEENGVLTLGLTEMQTSLMYAAPELKSFWWGECAGLLNRAIPNPVEPWQKRLADIFSGKEKVEQDGE